VSEQPDYSAPANLEVPDGHQATWRPTEGGPAMIVVEPVDPEPQPDLKHPAVAAGIAAHQDLTHELTREQAKELADEWAAAQARALEELRAREVEAAGDPTNIGPDGRPHFNRMVQTAEDPPAWAETCGTCGTIWPCSTYVAQRMADDDVQIEQDAGAAPAAGSA
jgi:hypothetical protein